MLWGALAVSLLAHLCALWWWRDATPTSVLPAPPSASALEVRVVRLAPPAVLPQAKPVDPGRLRSPRHERAIARRAPRSLIEPPQILPQAVDLEPVVPLDDLISSSKRAIGAIDRALRNELPTRKGLLQAPNNSVTARLERNIAAAAVEHGFHTQEVILGDGRRYTKVTTSRGTHCVWGRDPRPSVITGTVFDTMQRTTTCPR